MDYRLLIKIGCRFIALYRLIIYLGFLPNTIITIIDMQGNVDVGQGLSLISFLSPMAPIILLSILLWIYADKIAKLIVKEDDVENPSSMLDYDRIQLIAFSFAGVLTVAQALPEAVNLMIEYEFLMSQQLMSKSDKMQITYIARVIGQIIKMVLGLWLILGSKGIMKGIEFLRTAGTQEKNENGD